MHLETHVSAQNGVSADRPARPSERDVLLAFGRGPRQHYERDASIVSAFTAQVARTPDAIAVEDDRATMTYADLDRKSNKLANYLRSLGVGCETPVGIAFERSIELPVSLLGILKAGGAYVPLDASYPSERLAFMIDDADVKFVLTRRAARDVAPFSKLIAIDTIDHAAAIDATTADAPSARMGAEALAYVAYTSGSTGRPKGVAVVDRGVVRLVRGANYVEIDRDDVFLHYAPLAFDASTFEIWAPLLNGARLTIARPGTLGLEEFARTIQRFAVTTLWLTAPLFRMIVDAELDCFHNVRQLVAGGDVVPVAQAMHFLERFPACRLINGYGPTENTTFSCCYRVPSRTSISDGVPIGRPISNSTAYVLDERMQPLPIGVAGELFVGGDGLARGYLNLPELTAERFVGDPFSPDPRSRLYRTGDLARFAADGTLTFLGRIDHQVKIRGFRIELGEIEHVLRGHHAVADAAVSVVSAGSEKSLVAHVVPARGSACDETSLRAHVRSVLPQHMLPSRLFVINELPKHPSGKIDRVELARLAAEDAVAADGRTRAPVSNVEKRLNLQRTIVGCWCEALGNAAEPDLDENFFDAGGDSLRLLGLHDRLQKRLGVSFGIVELFEHSTIRKLLAFLNARVG